jgi:replicative DNA helicase
MIEDHILAHILETETYARKIIPFVKEEYFVDAKHRLIYGMVKAYLEEYNSVPTKEALTIDLNNVRGLSADLFSETVQTISELKADPLTDKNWLIDQTEKYCKERAIYIAIMNSINIIDGKDKNQSTGAIPTLLSEALAVSFDTSVGHDFLNDSDSRFDFYHHREQRIPFDLEIFNKITEGGLTRKSLNIILAATGVGKSLFMCHAAAANLTAGHNVLYITLEMAEEKIAERIDANLLNVTVDELKNLTKEAYDKKMDRLKSKCKGNIIVKEYPTSAAGSSHFRHLLQELKLKRKFIPDIIYIDYLNICASSRVKMGNSVNSYTYIKAIAEELRGLAVEFNVPIVSATQTNRDGYNNSDVDLANTAESFGLPATADVMFALISTEELENLNQLLVKQLKNRHGAITGKYGSFVIGMDRSKMRLYDAEPSAQSSFANDAPVMDSSRFNDDSSPFELKRKGSRF